MVYSRSRSVVVARKSRSDDVCIRIRRRDFRRVSPNRGRNEERCISSGRLLARALLDDFATAEPNCPRQEREERKGVSRSRERIPPPPFPVRSLLRIHRPYLNVSSGTTQSGTKLDSRVGDPDGETREERGCEPSRARLISLRVDIKSRSSRDIVTKQNKKIIADIEDDLIDLTNPGRVSSCTRLLRRERRRDDDRGYPLWNLESTFLADHFNDNFIASRKLETHREDLYSRFITRAR